jgi:hypothetical protein
VQNEKIKPMQTIDRNQTEIKEARNTIPEINNSP